MERIYDVMDIARYIINYSREIDSPVSNLQLQKILYYVQAAFLVEKDKKAFEEEILNWAYGPVVNEVYREYRIYGHLPIDKEQDEYSKVIYDDDEGILKIDQVQFDSSIFNNEDGKLIKKVVNAYIYMDPFDLVNKTHSEDPWENSTQNEVILTEDIKKYYRENKDKLYG